MDLRKKPAVYLKEKTTAYLNDIIDSRDFSDLNRRQDADKAALKKEAKRLCNDNYRVNHDHYGLSQSFFAALTDVPIYPILILCTILGLTTLGMIPLILTVTGLAGAAFIAGCIFFYATLREHHSENKKNESNFQLAALKLQALEIVIDRQERELIQLNQFVLPVERSHLSQHDPAVYSHLKQAVKATMLITTSLFSIAEVVIKLVSGAMLSPIVLGIALGVSLAIGLGFGISQYYVNKDKERITADHEELKSVIKKKKHYSNKMQNKINQIKTARAIEESVPMRSSGRSGLLRESSSSSPSPPPAPRSTEARRRVR